ncbi:MAG: aminotransferase class I/II-fold pyridoxal phosphate-dependent enzyme, partial [Cyclobacteriaceae bacterium]|nr:aminotransferase class I/II-fold pyridoxal phosphate-dependent enzyme [Cyclobacteriaceae bacterium]
MSNILERLLNQLEKRQENGSLRTLKRLKGLVDFSSNDYLGLAIDRQLAQIIWSRQRHMELHNGSGGSRLLTGNSQLTEELEQFLAAHFKGERALIFNSGYSANLALLAAIPQRRDTIIYDSSIHACIKEGSRLSNAKYHAFRHNDVTDLENKLRSVEGTAIVVIESVYSMDGDWAELEDIVEACDRYQADLIIDEAHTTGWCGPQGEGWVCAENLQDRFLARVYTFGKALGHH